MHPELPGPTLADFIDGWELFQDPVLAAVLAGATLGWLGVFVVLRRMVFVAATLSQAAGLGVALAFWSTIHLGWGPPPFVGAVLAALAAGAVASIRPERLFVSRDGLLAFTWLVAGAGVVLVGDHIAQEAHDIAGILFGSAVLVRPEDLAVLGGVSALALGVAAAAHRGLLFAAWDPEAARIQGLPVRLLDLTLLVLVTLAASAATRALGALPVFAFSVLPGLSAVLLAPRVNLAFLLALGLGAAAGGLGYLAAFLLELPVGASQAAVAALPVVPALALARLRR